MPAEALVLLHGALFSPAQLADLSAQAESDFSVLTPAFPGHGGSALPQSGFSIPLFTESVIRAMDDAGIHRAKMFGYSLGGYVALDMAIQFPDRIAAVATLGTKLDWSEETAAKETRLLNPEKMQLKIPGFVRLLESLHAPTNWQSVVEETAHFLTELGKNPVLTPDRLSEVNCPVLMLNGELDQTATPQAAAQWITYIAQGKSAVLPNIPHPFDACPVDILWKEVRRFLDRESNSLLN